MLNPSVSREPSPTRLNPTQHAPLSREPSSSPTKLLALWETDDPYLRHLHLPRTDRMRLATDRCRPRRAVEPKKAKGNDPVQYHERTNAPVTEWPTGAPKAESTGAPKAESPHRMLSFAASSQAPLVGYAPNLFSTAKYGMLEDASLPFPRSTSSLDALPHRQFCAPHVVRSLSSLHASCARLRLEVPLTSCRCKLTPPFVFFLNAGLATHPEAASYRIRTQHRHVRAGCDATGRGHGARSALPPHTQCSGVPPRAPFASVFTPSRTSTRRLHLPMPAASCSAVRLDTRAMLRGHRHEPTLRVSSGSLLIRHFF
jgi:hypothetical protein